ncbi:unnamed protein product [Peniophora sp. CBMAI 1063]|nr:unnamed protein product [Peniophora sp. CBMAI 1063]
MPFVDAANYPADFPQGGFHIDADNEDDYRLPRSLDNDLLIWKETNPDTGAVTWWMRTNARHSPQHLTADARANAISIGKDQMICDLQQTVVNQQAQLNAPPQPIVVQQVPGPQHSHICVHAPHTFSGVSNDKGVYDPTPRDFVHNVRNYLVAEEEAAGNPLTVHNKIVLVSTLLDQSAAMCPAAGATTPAYTGPLLNLDMFLQAFLQHFEDVDIQKTAIAKIQSMQQGAQSVEVHTRQFKDWAGRTGFNNTALIELYKKSLKPAIRDKVNGQGKHCLDTLQGWYEDAVLFDRQWREDHPDRPSLQSTTGNSSSRNQSAGANNNTGRSTGAWQQQQPLRNANQGQPRNGNWRPWGAPAQQLRAPALAANTGMVPMDIDAANVAMVCYRCGENHLARNCTTPMETIWQKYGWDRMIPFPPGYRARATTFANVDDFATSLSPADQAELARSLQSRVGAPAAPPAQASQQGFASGLS